MSDLPPSNTSTNTRIGRTKQLLSSQIRAPTMDRFIEVNLPKKRLRNYIFQQSTLVVTNPMTLTSAILNDPDYCLMDFDKIICALHNKVYPIMYYI